MKMQVRLVECCRLREQWEVEERGSSLEHARSVKQKPNPPISELQSIRELLEEVSSRQHAGSTPPHLPYKPVSFLLLAANCQILSYSLSINP